MTTHTIPRHSTETDRAYAAFVAYATMGVTRSLDKLRQTGGKAGATFRLSTLEEWSSRYDWQARVKLYDDALAQRAADEHAAQYLADIEAHRQRYGEAGRELYDAAMELLKDLRKEKAMLDLRRSLPVIARAFTTAADLEAHALKLDKLLPTLTNDSQHAQNP